MKKRLKQILSALLVAVMLVGVIPLSASAAYENTYTNTGNQRDDIIGVAKTQLGYTEGANNATKYGTWYGLPNQPWCAMFISWCARQAGISKNILQNSAVAAPDAKYFNIPYYDGASYTPQKGDLFFTKSWSHVGLVYYVDGSYFYTIEGNSNTTGSSEGTSVVTNRRKISNFYFGVPNYNSGTHTHSYVEKYEAAHPHKQYMSCSCGSYYYTGKTVYLENKDCCVKATSNWKFTDYDVPSISNLSYCSDFNIKGTVSSNVRINWVGVVLYDSTDKEIAQANAYPGSTSYNISDLNDQLDFSKLSVGKYRLLVHANNPNNDYTILYSEYFNVGAPTLAAPEVSIRTTSDGKAIFSWPAVTNADNYDIRIFDSNKESYKDIWSISKTSYEIELPDGYYYVWVCSSNSNFYYCFTYGNMCGFTVKKTVPEKPKLKNLNSYYTENSKIKFEWDSTERTTHYSLYLKKLNESTNEYEVYDYEMHYVESGYERYLPAGKYAIQLQASNSEDWSYTDGDWVEFTVYSAYTVSYNVNGGTVSIASQTKTHDTNLTLTTTKPTGKSFTVTYNANGGTVSSSSKTVSQIFTSWNTVANGSGTAYNAGATYSANASVTLYAQYANPSIGSLPTPTRSGYAFDGWYTAANGGTKITDTTKVTANTTVYAHWKANAYTVSYNVNGGTGSIASQTKTHDTNLTLTTTKPTGKSFTVTYNANGGTVSTSSKTVSQTFTSWNTVANGSGTAYNAGATYSANASVTLYAQYANPSIGSLPTPTRSGYAFDGWYTSANGGTKITDSTKVTANTTVYAHWKANAYTVSYKVNGGTGSIASQTKTHDTNLTLTTTKPTGKSFTVTYNANGGTVSTSSKTVSQTFTSWNTAANGSGTTYNAGATYSANASVTLYAQYANPSIGSLPTPTRSGYAFDGWYTSANGGTKITDSTNVTANITVYAHWTKNAEAKAVVKDVKIEHNATVNYKSTYMLSPEITADKGAKYTVKYSSSNTKVATVDENGKIYGAKKGNATITCTVTDSYGNVVTDKCNVNVDYSGSQWFIIIVLFGWIWYI